MCFVLCGLIATLQTVSDGVQSEGQSEMEMVWSVRLLKVVSSEKKTRSPDWVANTTEGAKAFFPSEKVPKINALPPRKMMDTYLVWPIRDLTVSGWLLIRWSL